jgi:hypothetical protein
MTRLILEEEEEKGMVALGGGSHGPGDGGHGRGGGGRTWGR